MTRWTRLLLIPILLLGLAWPAWAGDIISLLQSDGTVSRLGGSGDKAKVSFDIRPGENLSRDVVNIEFKNNYQTPVTADTLIVTGQAYVKWLTCSPTDNAAVAGTIQLRDSTTAGGGTIVVEWTVLAIDYTLYAPKVFPVDSMFSTGVYLDFTTTSDVKCWVSYR